MIFFFLLCEQLKQNVYVITDGVLAKKAAINKYQWNVNFRIFFLKFAPKPPQRPQISFYRPPEDDPQRSRGPGAAAHFEKPRSLEDSKVGIFLFCYAANSSAWSAKPGQKRFERTNPFRFSRR